MTISVPLPAVINVRATVIRAILSGIAITLIGSAPLSLLTPINAAIHPEWPWAAGVLVVFLLLLTFWLNGGGWPRASSAQRRYCLRLWRPEAGAWSAHRGEIIGLIGAIVGIYIFWDLASAQPEITDFSPYPTTAYRVTLFVMGAVISGGVEEMAFRGYMQSQLERIGPAFAVTVTSVVFALMHITHGLIPLLVMLPGYLLIAICFGQLALRTGSILPGMLLHIVGDASHAWYVLLGGDITRLVATQ